MSEQISAKPDSNNPAPGFIKHPGHVITLSPIAGQLRIRADGDEIGRSNDGIELNESGYEPVIYLPVNAFQPDTLVQSSRTSNCPFKGTASYWHVVSASGVIENAAWSYEEPYDEMSAIAGRIAFYRDKVEIAG